MVTPRPAPRRATALRPLLGVLAAAAALTVAPTFALAVAPGDEPPPNPAAAKAKPKGDGGAAARETLSALRELNAAVQAEARETGGVSAARPARPKKTAVPPSLTPADLDRLVDKFLEAKQAPPAAATTDVEFVRRVFLDVTGKLPTPEQTRAFVATREKDKRGKLIEYLLNSPEYAANWARYWRDVIQYRSTNAQFGRLGYADLESWLRDQLAKNRPWDEVARDLITATGRNDENGAVVFALSHEAQAVEMAGEVSRIFLGVQIQCAQCHDHPNDSWKRQQFHEFASFFAGTRARRATKPGEGKLAFEVVRQGKPRYTMPDLKEPTKAIPVAPKFFLDPKASVLPAGLTSAERHDLAASYVTGQDNPWFARAFVNRVWYALTGDSFYTPVDDLGPDRTARAPEVLDALASQWQRGGYDVKWLFRTILNSKTYQREVRSTLSPSGCTVLAANSPSRLRADQILDSLAQAVRFPADGAPGAGPAANKQAVAALKDAAGKPKAKGMGGGARPRDLFNVVFGVDPSVPNDDVLGTIPQSLFLMNNPLLNRLVEARPGTVLGEILGQNPDNRAALNALYLRVLAREPTPQEVQTCARYLDAVGNRREAFEDILWSLINSTEFVTRR